MKSVLPIVVFLVCYSASFGQHKQYVTAFSGLNVRSEPSLTGKKLGKLEYASQVEVLEFLPDVFTIKDMGKDIYGQWARINYATESNSTAKGYLFSGFLTSNAFPPFLSFKFESINLAIQGFEVWDTYGALKKTHRDTASIEVALGETPEYKYLRIAKNKFQKVEIFQRYENSVTILNEGPHCDMTEWEHFDSKWEKLPFFERQNAFRTLYYDGRDGSLFKSIDMEKFRQAVKVHCGESWYEHAKSAKYIGDYPVELTISSIFLKIVLTDFEGKRTEKFIEFVMPMGC